MPHLTLLSHSFLSQILHKLAHSNSLQFMRLQIDQLEKTWSGQPKITTYVDL